MSRAMTEFDYYKELQVSPEATTDEIRAAFRRMAAKYHPDRNPGDTSAEQKFKRIAEAYDVLGDPQKRATYDRGGLERVRTEKSHRTFESVDDVFSTFGDLFGDALEEEMPLEAPGRPGQNYETEIELSATEASSGGRRNFTIDEATACSGCGGSGAAPGLGQECPRCGGKGVLRRSAGRDGGFYSVSSPCPECGGQGASQRACGRCAGEGVHAGPREIELTIPRGIEDGTVLRLRGMGAPGSRGGGPGDLLVRVRVPDRGKPSPTVTKVKVDLMTALLGGSVKVALGSGSKRMRIPAGTQPGQMFRVRNGHGETLVAVDVEIPRDLTKRQRRLLEEYRKASS